MIEDTNKTKEKKKKDLIKDSLLLFCFAEIVDNNFLRLLSIASVTKLESTKENLLNFLNNVLSIAIKALQRARRQ